MADLDAHAVAETVAKEASGAPPLPQVFGRYLLLRRLSRGGMGEIFLAKLGEIQGFEKLVIIKKVLPNLAADHEFIKRFIDEAQVAIKLNHANIAPVFEVGRVDGEYFLGIAYIEGRDLRRTMTRLRENGRTLPPDLALYIARELAAGLAYAHRRTDDTGTPLNLVHCDISPPNVMLSFEGEVKVIDFGIARSAIRLAQSNPNMGFGKFGYMSPEQLLRGGIIDKRADLYAAGVVLHELLTGEKMVPAPEGGDYRIVARAVTQGRFPRPSERNPAIAPELDALVMKAIAVKPEERFQTGEALRDAIQTELARISPTISGDQLSAVLRDLFSDELSEERELLTQFQAVDLAPFRDELTEATVGHTVTFARATPTGPPGLRSRPRSVEQPVVAPDIDPTSESMRVALEEIEEPPVAPPAPQANGRRVLFVAFLAMLAGAVLMVFLMRPKPTPVVIVPAPPTPPVPVVTHPLPTGPVVTPLPIPVLVAEERHPAKKRQKTVEVFAAPVPHHSADAVQAKFQKVRSEYSAFKGQYGPVLEERWNTIASEITFGKADKFDKVDGLLDTLRREMSRVRDGQ